MEEGGVGNCLFNKHTQNGRHDFGTISKDVSSMCSIIKIIKGMVIILNILTGFFLGI